MMMMMMMMMVTRTFLGSVPGNVAIFGADLQFRGHHGADAGRKSQVHDRRQLLARHHDRVDQRHKLPRGDRPAQHAQPSGRGQQPAGGDSARPQRLSRDEETLLPAVSSYPAASRRGGDIITSTSVRTYVRTSVCVCT